jgi:nicotinate-nucleotide pyrophosphorylase (carboxylating)
MKSLTPPQPGTYEDLIVYALAEDTGWGDVTTDNLELPSGSIRADLIAREDCILAGWPIFVRTFFLVDETVMIEDFETHYEDGDEVPAGDVIAKLFLPAATLLKGERVALNFITHLSGIATATKKMVDIVGPEGPSISDTRKTLPGLRALQKYAVRAGGGMNHRLSLSHAVMIKNNHIALAGGISNAVRQVKRGVGHTIKIEVEASNLDEVKEALIAGVDVIMLDNFTPDDAAEAVKYIDRRVTVELSGNINADNISKYALVGADVISIGALTHSAKAINMAIIVAG